MRLTVQSDDVLRQLRMLHMANDLPSVLRVNAADLTLWQMSREYGDVQAVTTRPAANGQAAPSKETEKQIRALRTELALLKKRLEEMPMQLILPPSDGDFAILASRPLAGYKYGPAPPTTVLCHDLTLTAELHEWLEHC